MGNRDESAYSDIPLPEVIEDYMANERDIAMLQSVVESDWSTVAMPRLYLEQALQMRRVIARVIESRGGQVPKPGAAGPSNQIEAERNRLRESLASAEAALNPPPGPSAHYHRGDYPEEEWFNIAVRLSDLYHAETSRRIYWRADAMEAREENAQLVAEVKDLEDQKAALEKRIDGQRRAINEMVSLANEWSANRLGTVNLQRRRWEHMGEIARKAQEGVDHA